MAEFKRPDAALLSEAAEISTATMHEAGGKIGALPSAIKPASPEFEVCGPAYPVSGPAGDNLWLHRAIADAEPGDVLVAYLEDHHEAGYWGEIMSTAAMARNLGGAGDQRLRPRRRHFARRRLPGVRARLLHARHGQGFQRQGLPQME